LHDHPSRASTGSAWGYVFRGLS